MDFTATWNWVSNHRQTAEPQIRAITESVDAFLESRKETDQNEQGDVRNNRALKQAIKSLSDAAFFLDKAAETTESSVLAIKFDAMAKSIRKMRETIE